MHVPSQTSVPPLPVASDAPDTTLVSRVLAGEREWFAVVMRRYNGRLFRVARSITRDDAEAEDALQRAYVAAFRDLRSFRGDAKLSTWLTTIVVREAGKERRVRLRRHEVEERESREPHAVSEPMTPEQRTSIGELRRTLEAAVDSLPDHYRAVLVLRDVEELSGHETARVLEVSEEVVRVRLHRARGMMRERMERKLDVPWRSLFEFGGERCNRMVGRVCLEIALCDPQYVARAR